MLLPNTILIIKACVFFVCHTGYARQNRSGSNAGKGCEPRLRATGFLPERLSHVRRLPKGLGHL